MYRTGTDPRSCQTATRKMQQSKCLRTILVGQEKRHVAHEDESERASIDQFGYDDGLERSNGKDTGSF